MFAGPSVGEDGEGFADGFEEEGEEDEAGVWGDGGDAEGIVEVAGEGASGVGGEAEEEEDDAHLEDADGEALADVVAAEVADFMGEDAEEFGGVVFFDEGVVEGDFLAFSEAGEEGVGFGGAFGAVHHEDAVEWESAALAELLDGGFEFAFGHGGEFVVEGHDP